MNFIDQLISYMCQQKASATVISEGKPMLLYIGDQPYPQKQTLSHENIIALLRQLAPAPMQALIGHGENFEFPYSCDGGPMLMKVKQQDGPLELTITPQSGPAATGHSQATKVSGGDPEVDKHFNVSSDREGTRKVEHMDELFQILFDVNGSDVHVSSKEHPVMRVHGKLRKMMEYEKFTDESLKNLLWQIAPERNRKEWEATHDSDFAYEIPGLARFRCNLMADRQGIGGVFRIIPSKIATVEDLHLPKAMVDLCFLSKGLVVVTGPTGSGKSTTLAALVDYINRVRDDHIITIEDPIEFVHENNQCLVNQREVHVHTEGFKKALRAALREDPDIVLVGEMRDLETVAIAIETAETGHLVFGTLHTSSAASTVDRIIDQFPSSQQEQIRVMLSESLKAVVAQTLLRKKAGGRIAAWEILLVPPSVANLIREKKTFQLNSMIQVNKAMGMITMNDAVIQLVKDGTVEPMEAYIKVIDKTGLATMFEKEGIEFHPPSQEEMLKH
ncbi:MAG: type IV pilus twitching motility protein PilT [Armatimonadota bacterium]|nr:type IV pilus twitching motility protein PilT [Armatimonadota bacterium]